MKLRNLLIELNDPLIESVLIHTYFHPEGIDLRELVGEDQSEEDLGTRFDLRQCRRTFGQRYLDNGLDIESTSLLMGHASTKTTEGFYSRKRLDMAIENAIGTWNDTGGQ